MLQCFTLLAIVYDRLLIFNQFLFNIVVLLILILQHCCKSSVSPEVRGHVAWDSCLLLGCRAYELGVVEFLFFVWGGGTWVLEEGVVSRVEFLRFPALPHICPSFSELRALVLVFNAPLYFFLYPGAGIAPLLHLHPHFLLGALFLDAAVLPFEPVTLHFLFLRLSCREVMLVVRSAIEPILSLEQHRLTRCVELREWMRYDASLIFFKHGLGLSGNVCLPSSSEHTGSSSTLRSVLFLSSCEHLPKCLPLVVLYPILSWRYVFEVGSLFIFEHPLSLLHDYLLVQEPPPLLRVFLQLFPLDVLQAGRIQEQLLLLVVSIGVHAHGFQLHEVPSIDLA